MPRLPCPFTNTDLVGQALTKFLLPFAQVRQIVIDDPVDPMGQCDPADDVLGQKSDGFEARLHYDPFASVVRCSDNGSRLTICCGRFDFVAFRLELRDQGRFSSRLFRLDNVVKISDHLNNLGLLLGDLHALLDLPPAIVLQEPQQVCLGLDLLSQADAFPQQSREILNDHALQDIGHAGHLGNFENADDGISLALAILFPFVASEPSFAVSNPYGYREPTRNGE